MASNEQAKQVIRDAAMRRALLDMLLDATRDHRESIPDRPEPVRDDNQVAEDLRRILLNERPSFLDRIGGAM
jgi:hypothetical protein